MGQCSPQSADSFERKMESSKTSIRLFRRDCLEALPDLISPGSVDVVVTSPPYNLGIRYEGYQDDGPRDEYLDWLDRWAAVIKEILSDQGSLFLNIGSKPTDPWGPFEVLMVMRKHYCLQNVFHWIKSIAILKSEVGKYPSITDDIVVGHYKPVHSNRFVNNCHEYIFHLTKNGDVPLDRNAVGVPYQDSSNVTRWKSGHQKVHCRGNTWFIPYDTINDRQDDRPHPASFPVELPRRCIQLHGVNKVRLAVDPFLGIGPSAIACMDLGVNFTGFEISEDYFRIAKERVFQYEKSERNH